MQQETMMPGHTRSHRPENRQRVTGRGVDRSPPIPSLQARSQRSQIRDILTEGPVQRKGEPQKKAYAVPHSERHINLWTKESGHWTYTTWLDDTKLWVRAPEGSVERPPEEELRRRRRSAASDAQALPPVKEGKQEEEMEREEHGGREPHRQSQSAAADAQTPPPVKESKQEKEIEEEEKEDYALERLSNIQNPAKETAKSEPVEPRQKAPVKQSALTPKDKALELIRDYQTKNNLARNVFNNKNVEGYIKGIKDRIENPELIDQVKTGLCGVTAFMYSIARNDPEAYAQYALDLFQKGRATIGGFTVTASNRIKKSDKHFEMMMTDYVTCASLRIDQNRLPFNRNPSNLGGFSTPLSQPHSLPQWFIAAGYQAENHARRSKFSFGKRHFKKAVSHLEKGHIVCLALDWSLRKPRPDNLKQTIDAIKKDPFGKLLSPIIGPDHWVVLTGVREEKQTTFIDLYTYGGVVTIGIAEKLSTEEVNEQQSLKERTLMSWEWFLGHYYGYVVAWKGG